MKAPPALHRALKQIGLATRGDLQRLRPLLKPGQMLVTLQGDVARWDGFTAAAEAPSAAARRLAERNRLAETEAEAAAAIRKRDEARKATHALQRNLREAQQAETTAREEAREARRSADQLRERVMRDERAISDQSIRLSSLRDGLGRFAATVAEAKERLAAASAEASALPAAGPLEAQLAEERARLGEARAAAASLKADAQSIEREAAMIARRTEAARQEMADWAERRTRSAARLEELDGRIAAAEAEHTALDAAPDDAIVRRRAVTYEIEQAEAARKTAADARAEAETAFIQIDRLAKDALRTLGKRARHAPAAKPCARRECQIGEHPRPRGGGDRRAA